VILLCSDALIRCHVFVEPPEIMKLRPFYRRVVRLAVFVAVGATLCGCAALQGSPNGPGDCVGPPDFCTPFFGT
jgi:hypothetical protein